MKGLTSGCRGLPRVGATYGREVIWFGCERLEVKVACPADT